MLKIIPLILILLSSCGKNTQFTNKLLMTSGDIFGGKPVKGNQWPNVIQFGHKNHESQFSRSFCSGTLIDSKTVLTAAHCVRHYENNYAKIIITQKNSDEVFEDYSHIRKITLHPYYNKLNESSPYDFAIVELETPLKISSSKNHLLYQTPNLSSPVELIGFGKTDEGLTGTKYHVVTKIQGINELQFTAGGEGKDTCSGDSGGPVYQKDNYGNYYLIGVTSHSANDADVFCGDKTIYGKASLAFDWIRALQYLNDSDNIDSRNALILIEKATKLMPKFSLILIKKALILKELNRANDGIHILEDLLKQNPYNLTALKHLASFYMREGHIQKEIHVHERILALESGNLKSFQRLNELAGEEKAIVAKGVGAFHQNDIDQAITYLNRYPQNNISLFIRSFINTNNGDFSKALDQLNQIDQGIDSFFVNFQDSMGDSFLSSSSYIGKTQIVRKLISLGANLNHLDAYGYTVTHLAWWRKNLETLELLLINGAKWDIQKYSDEFEHFIKNENVEYIKFLLKHNYRVSCLELSMANASLNPEVKELFLTYQNSCDKH